MHFLAIVSLVVILVAVIALIRVYRRQSIVEEAKQRLNDVQAARKAQELNKQAEEITKELEDE